MSCETEDGARGIITFDRKLHRGKLTDEGEIAIQRGGAKRRSGWWIDGWVGALVDKWIRRRASLDAALP
jgi:hypothetical protein